MSILTRGTVEVDFDGIVIYWDVIENTMASYATLMTTQVRV